MVAPRMDREYGGDMELLLIIGIIVVGVVALLLISGREGDVVDAELSAARIDPDRQFRRPPGEGDLL